LIALSFFFKESGAHRDHPPSPTRRSPDLRPRLPGTGIAAPAGDRRDEDMRELGEVAARHFDVVLVREDEALRGRERGETARLVEEGVRRAMDDGARCRQVDVVLDEITAVRHAMSRANRGDLVVVCVDKHAAVMAELEEWSQQAQAGSSVNAETPAADPDYLPPAEA